MVSQARRLPILLLILLIAGCGGTDNGGIGGGGQLAPLPGDNLGQGTVVEEKQGFSLRILDPTTSLSSATTYQLDVEPRAGGASVSVRAEATALSLAYIELSYDAEQLHPTNAEGMLWPGEDEVLRLAVLDLPGRVYYGAVLPGADNPGVSGPLELLRIDFANGAAPLREVAAFPTAVNSQVTDLTVDTNTGDVAFTYFNQGDHDQNSQVNIADLTPLGANFGTGDGTPFSLASELSQIDGDGNGQINISDITPIGANFGATVHGWHLYAGTPADYPEPPTGPNGAGAELVGEFAFGDAIAEPGARLRYAANIPEVMGAGTHFWVRAHENDADGIASLTDPPLPTGEDTTAPTWLFDPEGVGIVQLVAMDSAIKVYFGEAVEEQSSPITYTVYYSEGNGLDLENATTIEITPAPGDPDADAPNELAVLVEGLTNETPYSFLVRARDAAGNEEQNDNFVTQTPQAEEVLPASINGGMFFFGPQRIAAGDTVDVEFGHSITFHDGLVIDEGATLNVSGNCTIEVSGDLTLNGSIIHDAGSDPVPDPGDAAMFTLLLTGNADFGENSIVQSNGNCYIVDDPADAGDPEGDVADTDNGDPGEFPFNFDPVPEEQQASALRFSTTDRGISSARYWSPDNFWHIWRVRGDWGQVPQPPPGTKRIILKVRARNGKIAFDNWTITGPHGEAGADHEECATATGEDGKDNPWRMRIHAAHLRWLGNNVITFGNGGKGGNATATDCCPKAIANGGIGGKPNNKFRFTGSSSFSIPDSDPPGANTLTINPGAGGEGGSAFATGGSGLDGCPPSDGCDADALGGDGGSAGKFGLRSTGGVGGLSNVTAGILRGGRGGDAEAAGGTGGNDTCCGIGGAGGDAFASAGEGGDAESAGVSPPMGGGGCQGGDGGNADSTGGLGGNGSDCFKKKGGDGGEGGTATAFAGVGGIATPSPPGTLGINGDAAALGGDGGNGGDGFPPGGGGAGGTADAEFGVLNNEIPGTAGDPGSENPVGGIVTWCIDMGDLAPPQGGNPNDPIPIPNGHSGMAELENMSTGQPDGTMPFVWSLPPGSQAIYHPSTGLIELNGQALLAQDSAGVQFFSADMLLNEGVSSKGFIGFEVQFGLCVTEQLTLEAGVIAMYDATHIFNAGVPVNLSTEPFVVDVDVTSIPMMPEPTFSLQVTPFSIVNFDEIWFIDP